MAQTKQSSTQFHTNDLMDLTSEYQRAVFGAAVETRQATDQLVQNWIEAGLTFQESQLRSTRDWLQSLHTTQQEYVKQGSELIQKAMAVSPTSLEFPFKKEVEQFTALMVLGMQKTFEFFTRPLAVKS